MNNKFGIDEKSYSLIIEFFKNHSQIKIVKLFGCPKQACQQKCLKTLNLIMFGIYTSNEFLKLKETLTSLKQPYTINLFNSYSYHWYDEINYIETQWNKSPIFYRSEDYKNYTKELKINLKSKNYKSWEIDFIELLKRICCVECNLLERKQHEIMNKDESSLKIDLYKTLHECYMFFINVLNDYFQYQIQGNRMLPRDLLKTAFDKGIIVNLNTWYSMIDDFNRYYSNNDYINFDKFEKDFHKFENNVKNIYLPELKRTCDILKSKSKHKFDYIDLKFYKNEQLCNQKNPNDEYFGLSKDNYEMIINFFKQRPAIKYARIGGSRSKKSRTSSDLDLFIEGTAKDYMVSAYCTAINKIRQPYFIDFANIQKSLITNNHRTSFYFYKRKDYFNDDYIEKGPPYPSFDVIIDKRWVYRYSYTFYKQYIYLENTLKYFHVQPFFTKMKLITDFKSTFDFIWKLLKDYLKDKNINVLTPRKIFKMAYNYGLIDNLSVWYEMIFDWNILETEDFNMNYSEMFYRIQNKYMPEFTKIFEHFKSEAELYKPFLICSLNY